MRDDYQLQCWIFVNFIALILRYRVYSVLRRKDLLSRYSPEDVIKHLERISMIKSGGCPRFPRNPER